jgi:heme exporter protein D
MPDLGPHAVFIWAAYGVTALAVAALVAFIVADDRHQRQLLAELERQGITRRSAKSHVAKPAVTATSQGAKAASKPKASPGKARARKPKP